MILKRCRLLFGLSSVVLGHSEAQKVHGFCHQFCTSNNSNYVSSALVQLIDWAFPLAIENPFVEDNVGFVMAISENNIGAPKAFNLRINGTLSASVPQPFRMLGIN